MLYKYNKMSLEDSLILDNYTSKEIKLIVKNKIPEFSTELYKKYLTYRTRTNDFKLTLHLGQRKLLLGCIQFLNDYGHMADIVVYAGAAPGHNIIILSNLFPNITFNLYDPRDFDKSLSKIDQINVFQEYFTDKIAKQYKKKRVLFISDIRTGSITDTDFEGQIQQNNEMQRKWHDLIKPKMGMYKFRLPYKPGKTHYMDGIIRLQAWGPQTTTETRLIVPKIYNMVEYDNTLYESQMFHFNVIVRQWGIYPSQIQSVKDTKLCDCYDCRLEIDILSNWITSMYDVENEKLYMSIDKLSEQISQFLKQNLHLPPHVSGKSRNIRNNYINLRKRYKTVVTKRRNDKIKYRSTQLDSNCTVLK